MNGNLSSDEIIKYLSSEKRRGILNWRGIEKSTGISHGRIKNVMYKPGLKGFTEEEVFKLNECIKTLQLE